MPNPALTWAFSTLACVDFSLDETCALASRYGAPALELRGLGGMLDLPAYLHSCYGVPARLADRRPAAPPEIVVLDASAHLFNCDSAGRAELAALAPWADALGAHWIRVFDGVPASGADPWHSAQETLDWWRSRRLAAGWRVDLVVETHDSLFTADQIVAFRESFPDVALLWDAHNTWRRSGESPLAAWPRIAPAVRHLHVKDSVSRPSPRHPYTYVLPGTGEFPFHALLAALRRDSYSGCICLEWERHWHPYLPPIEDALAAAAQAGWW